MSDFTETKQKAEEVAHNVFLAGLGSCSKSLSFVQSGIGKSQELLDEFIIRGEKVESSAKGKMGETQEKIKSTTDKVKVKREELLAKSKTAFEERVQMEKVKSRVEELRTKLAENVNIPKFETDEAIAQVREKIDEISKEVNERINTLRKS